MTYEIPCLDCNNKNTWVNFHVVPINKFTNTREILKRKHNGLVKHNLETNHNFNLKDSEMFVRIHNKNTGKLLNFLPVRHLI